MFGSVVRKLPTILLSTLAIAAVACTTAAPAPTATAAPPPKAATAAPAAPTPTVVAATSAPTKASAPAAASTATPAAPSATITLQWFGQSTFLLTTSSGTKLLMDPAAPSTGYNTQPIQGVDVVTISHEHADHNYLALAPGNPVVLRGLKENDWAQVDQAVKDIKIRSYPTYHDAEGGAKRGKNAIFVLEADGLRLAHLGDLGHPLTQEQATALGKLDVLMVPVGGFYTIDAAEATQLATQLSPKVVVPMHYKTPKMQANWPGGPVDPFLEGKKVERVGSNKVMISKDKLPAVMTVYVLGYES